MLCCDEKTQCQALERTQPGLPLGRGHIRTRTHDYIRHGTVTLFAALSYLEGKLIYRTSIAPNSSTRTWSGCVFSSRSTARPPATWTCT